MYLNKWNNNNIFSIRHSALLSFHELEKHVHKVVLSGEVTVNFLVKLKLLVNLMIIIIKKQKRLAVCGGSMAEFN